MRLHRWLVPLSFLASATALAQDRDFGKTEVKVVPAGGAVSMLVGEGGNIGVSVGADGVFVIDDQFAPLVPKIRAAIKTLSDKPIRVVINTHWHGDHTGGNAGMAETGAVIVAHDNVRKRLSTEQFNAAFNRKTPPASNPLTLPIITFADSVTLHVNGEDVEVRHVAPAHTDGDSIIHFKKSNVLHMGDTFFNGNYPFIDVDSGGSIDGAVAAADAGLSMADGTTKIIPGHGPMGTKADLQKYRDVVAGIRDKVKALVAQGKTLDQILAAKPSAQWDAAWGGGFMKPDVFVGVVYRSLTGKLPPPPK
jgi:glyoxylase-like metal-dependent hydrolase (beta-lactamase superfamily II)